MIVHHIIIYRPRITTTINKRRIYISSSFFWDTTCLWLNTPIKCCISISSIRNKIFYPTITRISRIIMTIIWFIKLPSRFSIKPRTSISYGQTSSLNSWNSWIICWSILNNISICIRKRKKTRKNCKQHCNSNYKYNYNHR